MLRRLLCVAALAVSLLAGARAFAQDGGVGSWATSDFFIGVQAEQGANLSDFNIERFFNKARCDCDTPVFLYFTLSQTGIAKRATSPRTGTISFWVGRDCGNTTAAGLEQRCTRLDSVQFSEFLLSSRRTIETNARVLSTDTSAGAATAPVFTPNPTCTLSTETFSQQIYALLDIDNNGVIDTTATRGVTIEPGFQSCAATSSGAGIAGLDPAFVCSPLLATTTRSFRIKILQNDVYYGAAVVAVDKRGNASVIDSNVDIVYEKPIRTKSFYDVYRDGDPDHQGAAAGGFCALAPERASTRVGWALAGAAAAVAVVIARRRSRR
jgi:hypothetical protein